MKSGKVASKKEKPRRRKVDWKALEIVHPDAAGSDIQECQWLLKLHTFGLLNNSFQPTDEIRVARTMWRHRSNLVAQAGSAIQRMQKALTEMNVQIHNVLSDLSGVSGMAIMKAIL